MNTTVGHFFDLEMTQFRLLIMILGVCKRDFTSNEMILNAASSCGVTILPLKVVIRKRQLTYLGHILRHDTTSLLYQFLHSECQWQDGKRRRGGQEQSFRRSIMSDLDCFNIAYSTAKEYSSLKDTCEESEVWKKSHGVSTLGLPLAKACLSGCQRGQ